MNRRHFVQVTGTSLASLLISQYASAKDSSDLLIRMPDAVSILSGDEVFNLQSSDKQTWTYKNVTVRCKEENNSLVAFVTSPALSLKEVRCSWRYAAAKNSLLLGDAWERTYGDVRWQKADAVLMPWYCVQHTVNNTYCFGVKTGGNAFCGWRVADGKLTLQADIRNGGDGVKLGERELRVADIVTAKDEAGENTFATVRRFCKRMCTAPRKVKQPVYGINDWYFAYGNNSSDLILKHTSLLAPLATSTDNLPFSVVDDGWETGSDFTKPNAKFPDMEKLTGDIKKLGMRTGLWTRPLLAPPGIKKNRLTPPFQNDNKNDGGVMDPTIEENIVYIKSLMTLYKDWGFEMVKHDYSTFDIFSRWGVDMGKGMTEAGWHFNDTSRTNAEVILHLYQSLREAAGTIYLIGCNTVSHLSAGIFELNRTGDDTSGKEWERTRKMGVNTMGFRMVQHKTFYEADGDCVGLTTTVPWAKNKQWMQLLAQSSAPLFISAQPEAVGNEQKAFIKQCFTQAAKPQPVGEPLDWLNNPYPEVWKLDGKTVRFDWS